MGSQKISEDILETFLSNFLNAHFGATLNLTKIESFDEIARENSKIIIMWTLKKINGKKLWKKFGGILEKFGEILFRHVLTIQNILIWGYQSTNPCK